MLDLASIENIARVFPPLEMPCFCLYDAGIRRDYERTCLGECTVLDMFFQSEIAMLGLTSNIDRNMAFRGRGKHLRCFAIDARSSYTVVTYFVSHECVHWLILSVSVHPGDQKGDEVASTSLLPKLVRDGIASKGSRGSLA